MLHRSDVHHAERSYTRRPQVSRPECLYAPHAVEVLEARLEPLPPRHVPRLPTLLCTRDPIGCGCPSGDAARQTDYRALRWPSQSEACPVVTNGSRRLAYRPACILGGQLLEPQWASLAAHLVLINEPQRHIDCFRGQRLQLQVGRPDDVLDESGLTVADVNAVTIRQTRHGQASYTLRVPCQDHGVELVGCYWSRCHLELARQPCVHKLPIAALAKVAGCTAVSQHEARPGGPSTLREELAGDARRKIQAQSHRLCGVADVCAMHLQSTLGHCMGCAGLTGTCPVRAMDPSLSAEGAAYRLPLLSPGKACETMQAQAGHRGARDRQK